MKFIEAVQSGKPFKRSGWDNNTNYIKVKGENLVQDSIYESIYTTPVSDMLKDDWILKPNCEYCKDTKYISIMQVNKFMRQEPCPKCYTPLKRAEEIMKHCQKPEDIESKVYYLENVCTILIQELKEIKCQK